MLLTIEFDNLHQVLRSLYSEMIPLCGNMIGIAKALGGLGALFYVSSRVWQSLARAEPIDVYPMLRPFAIGLCILFFPTIVLSTLNGVLSPVVTGTEQILNSQTFDMQNYRKEKDKLEKEVMLRSPETAYLVSQEEFDKKIENLGLSPTDLATISGMYIEREMYELKKSIQEAFQSLLELIFQSASLIIDTIRTFFLIVLSILGPIAFAISIWDGFQSTMVQWFTRYISVYFWLPVSNLFGAMLGKIQVLMLTKDIEALKDPGYIPDSSNNVYTIFMLLGIIGYFTIPTVSNWIIQAGGMGNYNRNVSQSAQKVGNVAGATAGSIVGNIRGRLKK